MSKHVDSNRYFRQCTQACINGNFKKFKEFISNPKYGLSFLIGCYQKLLNNICYQMSFRECKSDEHFQIVEYLVNVLKTHISEDAMKFICRHMSVKMVRLMYIPSLEDVYTEYHKNMFIKELMTEAMQNRSIGNRCEIIYFLIDKTTMPFVITNSSVSDHEFVLRYVQFMRRKHMKKIYFWWVQVCYDTNRISGQRSMQKSYDNHKKMINGST